MADTDIKSCGVPSATCTFGILNCTRRPPRAIATPIMRPQHIGLRMNMSRRYAPVYCCDLEEAQCLLAECMANVNEK